MATRDVDSVIDLWQFSPKLIHTSLPSFPDTVTISNAIPGVSSALNKFGKVGFGPWIAFTLEHPDEIWDLVSPSEDIDHKMLLYFSFFGDTDKVPAFCVEVNWLEEGLEVNNFVLVTELDKLERLRSGNLVFSARKEWEREKLVRSLNDAALTKYDEDRLDEAHELINQAIHLSNVGRAYLFNNRGLIRWKLGLVDQAKQDFVSSINLDDENGDPYFNLGLIYLDESDSDKALHYLAKAADIDPEDSQFLTELGHLYLEMDREKDALVLFKKTLNKDTDDAQVYFHLGHYFLYKKRQPRSAVKYYNLGLRTEPSDQFALADYAVAHLILGNRKRTLELRKIIESSTDLAPYTVSRLVYLNLQMGYYDDALKYYEQALVDKEPFEPEWLHYNAALIYASTGRYKQALAVLDLAVQAGGAAVIEKALSDGALQRLKKTPLFRKLVRMSNRRQDR
ncbi:MAG: tetratricopeptide repeat protein [Desulfomonilaceae bacterium]|jgi:tetratricopeptide (TPR) repeat protein